jgi:hypothetical protein
MQITLNFDTDKATADKIYSLLMASRPAVETIFVAGSTGQKVSETGQEDSEAVPSKPSHAAKTPGQDAATVKANRQASAQKAREAAATKKAAEQAAAAKAGIVGLGPIDGGDHPEDLNGSADDDEDIGLTDPGMSPGEARDAGLALVREAYAAGHVAPVKILQKAWGVSKFYDVPVEKGNEFYQQAMKLAQETGIRR